jgi:hypothetical protein
LYQQSPENRKSLTVVESISAGGKTIPPVIIVEGKQHMESWYHKNLQGDEMVLLSESGYTNEKLSLDWLKHFIKHTESVSDRPDLPWKVLLMDGHRSHLSPEFVLLALQYNIQPYQFPGHLTHVMQPLDIGVFQPYKHWHQKAIQHALYSLEVDYNIASFLRDLSSIRTDTFKTSTVKSAFRKSGMWPISMKTVIEKMKIYSPPQLDEPSVPLVPQTPRTIGHVQQNLDEWEERIPTLLSSPSADRYKSLCRGTRTVLSTADIGDMSDKILQARVEEDARRKTRGKRGIQKGGALTASQARHLIQKREAAEKATEEKRALRAAKKKATAY